MRSSPKALMKLGKYKMKGNIFSYQSTNTGKIKDFFVKS